MRAKSFRRAALVVVALQLMSATVALTPAAASGAAIGVDTACRLSNGDSCVQEVKGTSVWLPGRGGVVTFTCSLAVTGPNAASLLATSIPSCTATGLTSGEVVSALPGGTQTPASATVGASTVQTDDTYKVCMDGLAFYISGQVPIPQFCTTLHVPLAVDASSS